MKLKRIRRLLSLYASFLCAVTPACKSNVARYDFQHERSKVELAIARKSLSKKIQSANLRINHPFRTVDDAMREALTILTPISNYHGLEVAVSVYRIGENDFRYADILIGNAMNVKGVKTYSKTVAVGHTHPQGNQWFSEGDLAASKDWDCPIYLGTQAKGVVTIGMCNDQCTSSKDTVTIIDSKGKNIIRRDLTVVQPLRIVQGEPIIPGPMGFVTIDFIDPFF